MELLRLGEAARAVDVERGALVGFSPYRRTLRRVYAAPVKSGNADSSAGA